MTHACCANCQIPDYLAESMSEENNAREYGAAVVGLAYLMRCL